MKRFALALGLVLGASVARAEDAPPPPRPGSSPVREAKTAPLPASLQERVTEGLGRVARRSPLTRNLAVATTGKVRLAVVLVELADTPRPAFGPKDWEKALFSSREYVGRDAQGVERHGSVHDYYMEQSAGQLEITGKVFDWVSIAARRAEVEGGVWLSLGARHAVLDGALDALERREGPHALDGFDALSIVVTGGWAKKYGSVLWPHSSLLLHKGKPWRYYLVHAGNQGTFEPIGVPAHELGHVLGLPDEYGIGHRAGSGIYCCMAIGNHGGADAWVPVDAKPLKPFDALEEELKAQLGQNLGDLFGKKKAPAPLEEAPELFCMAPPPGAEASGTRPLHLCAPCKIALGWVAPVALDPHATQRLYLENVEDHPKDVVAVPLGNGQRLVLEYRAQRGFDAALPRSGLLAWKTGDLTSNVRALTLGANGELLPAHGVTSVDAAHRGPAAVMFPWLEHRELTVGRVHVRAIEEENGRLYLEVGE
jgi:M6 family metalloprotease-like protein